MQPDRELNYLTKSLLHHPSPYIIYELDGSIAWANLAAKYIFNLSSLDEISVVKIDDQVKNNFGDLESIALYYDTPIEISLRDISFFMRTRIHMIPVTDENGIMLIELLCQSRDGLDALKETIECIENDRVELAYQKQYDQFQEKLLELKRSCDFKMEKGDIFQMIKSFLLLKVKNYFL